MTETPKVIYVLTSLIESTIETMREHQRDDLGACVACGFSGLTHHLYCPTQDKIEELENLLDGSL